MIKTVICTTCPSGCEMKAELGGENELKVTGNRCKRGEIYCRNEYFEPKRIFTASVKIEGCKRARLPVRSREAVPKDMLMRCAEEAGKTVVEAPVRSHDVVIHDIAGSGIDVIASMTLEREV